MAARYAVVFELECIRCGNAWEVWGSLAEGGAWIPADDADLFCARCGADGGEGGGDDG